MNSPKLYKKFNEATTWNGVLFVFTNLNKTITTLFLYKILSAADFSLWANIYSLIFITLLWTDFGFRRSLPQYCLEFAKNKSVKNKFLISIIFFQTIISILAGTILYILGPKILTYLNITNKSSILALGGILFIVEGVKSVTRLLFYSYFWQKQFNFLETIILCINSVVVLTIIGNLSCGHEVIKYIFWSDILSGGLLIFLAGLIANSMIRDRDYSSNQKINPSQLIKDFAIHSGVMWSLLSTNSLTERNFLVPFLTYTLGAPMANIFKVANDIALLFQRFVIKTIGTTGTSLFAHLETQQLKISKDRIPKVINNIFNKLTKRIITLISILLGIVFFIHLQLSSHHSQAINIFLLLTCLYLLQITFMAYDRILEVKRNYKKLFISFIPYIGIASFFVLGLLKKKIAYNLLEILVIIHLLRIISIIIRIYFVRKLYKISFPTKYLATILPISLLTGALLSFLIKFFEIPYISTFLLYVLDKRF